MEKYNAHVEVKEIENITGGKLKYVVIETEKGKLPISIGDKNYEKLIDLLKPREVSTTINVLPPENKK